MLKDELFSFGSYLTEVTKDISEEKRLSTANAYFAHFAEKSENVHWVLDITCQKQLYLNPAYEKIWGRKRENLYNNPGTWIETVHPDDREANTANSRLLMLLENGPQTYYENEYRIVRPDGEIRWIKDTSFPIYANKECIGFAGIAEDITKEKNHNQALLEAKEKAESANRAKTEFLSAIVNELREHVGNKNIQSQELLNRLINDIEHFANYDLNKDNSSLELVENSSSKPLFVKNQKQINSNDLPKARKTLGLSKRESECAYYLTRGMTMKLVAKAMGLSPRTVEFYIENMKDKLGCHMKSDLIARLLDAEK